MFVEKISLKIHQNSKETFPLRIKDRRTKHLREKEILSVKVTWGGAAGEDAT